MDNLLFIAENANKKYFRTLKWSNITLNLIVIFKRVKVTRIKRLNHKTGEIDILEERIIEPGLFRQTFR